MQLQKGSILILLLSVTAAILGTYLYLMYFADTVHNQTHPIVSVGVVPAAIGATAGLLGSVTMSVAYRRSVSEFLHVPIVCSALSLALTGYAMLMMVLNS